MHNNANGAPSAAGRVHTTVVAPYFIQTGMFAGIRTSFLGTLIAGSPLTEGATLLLAISGELLKRYICSIQHSFDLFLLLASSISASTFFFIILLPPLSACHRLTHPPHPSHPPDELLETRNSNLRRRRPSHCRRGARARPRGDCAGAAVADARAALHAHRRHGFRAGRRMRMNQKRRPNHTT